MKCIQQVSAHRENTQPHPKRVADVTTKLLFACYTNHYAASEAKAPLAVVAVRSKPHRTRVTQLLHRNTQCQGSGTASSRSIWQVTAAKGTEGHDWVAKAASGTLSQVLPLLPAKDKAERWDMVLVTQHPTPSQQGHRRMLRGPHQLPGCLLASRMSKEIILPTRYRV